MTKEKQIEALARLDDKQMGCCCEECSKSAGCNYPESFDAIIPLIRKQSRQIQIRMMKLMAKIFGKEIGWEASPSQLSEALLRAHGLWEE